MQQLQGGDTRSNRAVDIDIFGIDDIADTNFRRGDHGSFVNIPRDGNMRMLVNYAGSYLFVRAVDDSGSGWGCQPFADLGEFSVLNQEIGVGENAVILRGPDRGVFDQEIGDWRQGSNAVCFVGESHFGDDRIGRHLFLFGNEWRSQSRRYARG